MPNERAKLTSLSTHFKDDFTRQLVAVALVLTIKSNNDHVQKKITENTETGPGSQQTENWKT